MVNFLSSLLLALVVLIIVLIATFVVALGFLVIGGVLANWFSLTRLEATAVTLVVGILLTILIGVVVLFGMGYGGEIPLTVAFRGELWGRKAFATLGGIAAAFYSIGTVAAPVLAGYLFDVSGSYTVAFYAFMALITVSGFAFLAIRQPKAPPRLGGIRTAG